MILTWFSIAKDKLPNPGQVALTYHPDRTGPVQYDVLIWCKGLGKDPKKGGFGRMRWGKRASTVEYMEPPPTHWAPIGPDVVPLP